MRSLLGFCFGLAILGFASGGLGAETSPAYEHLQPLEWQVGDWVCEYQVAADSGPIKAGDTVKVRFTTRWSPDKSFLVNTSQWEANGKRVASATEVIFWDHEKSRIGHSYYGTWGSGQGVWTTVGDKPVLQWTIQGPYGTFKGTSYATRGDDSWAWQIKEQTHDGEKMPDMPEAMFHRTLGAPAGDLWNAWRDAAVGTWKGQGVIRGSFGDLPISVGDKFTMHFALRPEVDGKAAVGETEFELVGKPYTTKCGVLAGWDPDTRQIRFLAIWGGGLVEEIVITGRRGNTFQGTYTTKLPARPTTRSRISIDFPDQDHYAIKLLDGPYKGETLSSFTRLKGE